MKWLPRPLSRPLFGAAAPAPSLVIAALIDWAGNGLYLAIIPIYVTSSHAIGSTEYGVVVSVGAMVGFAGPVPIGFFADRFQPKRILIALELMGAAACVALSFSRAPISVFVFVAILLMMDRGIAPLIQSLVGALSDEDRRVRTMAIVRTSGNIGVALGGLGAAATLAVGSTLAFRVALLADGASFAAAAILIGWLRVSEVKPVEFKRLGLPWSIRDPKFITLSALNGFLDLHKPILLVALPLWIVHQTRAPHVLVAVIFVLNSVLVILLQIPVSRGREGMPGAGRALWQSAFLIAAACVMLSLALRTTQMAVMIAITLASAILITLGELAQSVGAWAVSFALATEDQRSMYLAVFGLGNIVRDVIGPVLVTALAVHEGAAGWLVIASVLAISGVATQVTLRSGGREAPPLAQPVVSSKATTQPSARPGLRGKVDRDDPRE